MGMGHRLGAEWQAANVEYLGRHQRASDVAGSFGALSKTLRFMLQSGMLGLGAWLVLQGQATGGIIIAGSILLGRALAPVDGVIANSKNFVNARQSWARLSKLLGALPVPDEPLSLHPPRARLTVSGLVLVPPGGQAPLVHDVSFEVGAGQAVGVIGPSGSGKSCLSRAIVGAWQPVKGKVQLDGASLNQWSPEAIGRHIGYLPQDVELFAGTIARNIARFEPNADPNAIIAAAQAAGVHNLITSFPDGYDTQIGEQGAALSAGQRQRVALARALYRDPFLIVLDEPNSNLDAAGEQALLEAIEGVKARGGIVVVVAHRPDVLAAVDHIIAMQNGRALSPLSTQQIFANLMQGRSLPQGRPQLPANGTKVLSRVLEDAELKRTIEDGRPPDAVYTLSAEPGVGADAASGKPRLRLAANTTPPPLHKSSERQS
jgi:PrtD family type I secretion system ABC transporter